MRADSGRVAARERRSGWPRVADHSLPRGGIPIARANAPGGEAGDQRVAVNAQAARRTSLVPVLALERAQDVRLFEALPRLLERQGRGLGESARLAHLVDREIERQVLE